MNCSRCGARNPQHAMWCTQCFEPVEPSHAGDVVAPDEPAAGGTAPVASARAGDVRVTGELVEWRCRRCDGWNALELAGCVACGAPREGFGTNVATASVPVGTTTALLSSSVLPGLGHILLGVVGTGIARAVLFVVWVAGGVALINDATTGGIVLFLGALVLWAATLVDVQRLPTGHRELLGARGLGVLVAAVTVLLVLGAMFRAVGA